MKTTFLRLVILLLAACSSSKKGPPPAQPTQKNTREVKVPVTQISVEPGEPPAVAFELARAPGLPRRLKADFDAGRSWLAVREPRRYSFAARDILLGKTMFLPAQAEMTFAQETAVSGTPRRNPVLIRFQGTVARKALALHVTSIPDPELTPEGLEVIEHEDLRIMLGRGVDLLLATAGSTDLDIHVWVAVIDAQGKPIEWRPVLIDAYQARSVALLRPYGVVVMRRRQGFLPRYFRLGLEQVVIAAQMILTPREEEIDWIWEGVWFGRLQPPPKTIQPPAWPDLPLLHVVYKEFQRPAGSLSGFWPALLKPLALGADVGVAFIEGEPLIESVARKQRDRG